MNGVKDISNEDSATLYEMFDYLCSKIDFSRAALDATAIRSMDNLFKELRKDDRKFEL